jgi:RNA polymerase sigma-70 factor (ECF subfamily)
MARSYDPSRGRLTQWLYRSIRNRAIDHVRRRSRVVSRTARSIDGPEALLEMVPARGASPLDEAEAHELLELIARLDGRYAPLIRLSFVDGWSHSAIARMTGLPLGTVKTRIRNGLRQLRPLMIDLRDRRRQVRSFAFAAANSSWVRTPDSLSAASCLS